MSGKMTRRSLLAGMACIALSGTVNAATPVSYTTIHVDNMHCDACAKKIAGKLYALPQVAEVRADVPKSIAYVVPHQTKTPSPRAMWEAVEQAGFKPVKLVGPAGSFTSKPRS